MQLYTVIKCEIHFVCSILVKWTLLSMFKFNNLNVVRFFLSLLESGGIWVFVLFSYVELIRVILLFRIEVVVTDLAIIISSESTQFSCRVNMWLHFSRYNSTIYCKYNIKFSIWMLKDLVVNIMISMRKFNLQINWIFISLPIFYLPTRLSSIQIFSSAYNVICLMNIITSHVIVCTC